jgi:hypothetical protein
LPSIFQNLLTHTHTHTHSCFHQSRTPLPSISPKLHTPTLASIDPEPPISSKLHTQTLASLDPQPNCLQFHKQEFHTETHTRAHTLASIDPKPPTAFNIQELPRTCFCGSKTPNYLQFHKQKVHTYTHICLHPSNCLQLPFVRAQTHLLPSVDRNPPPHPPPDARSAVRWRRTDRGRGGRRARSGTT